LKHNLRLGYFTKIFMCHFFELPLSKDETRRDSSLNLMLSQYTVIKTMFMYFCVWFS